MIPCQNEYMAAWHLDKSTQIMSNSICSALIPIHVLQSLLRGEYLNVAAGEIIKPIGLNDVSIK